MKKLILGALGLLMIIGVVACNGTGTKVPAGQKLENQQQSADTASIVNNQPIPHFNYSQYRQNLIEIETAQANGVQTTSFFMNQGVPDPIGDCPSIGTPIPNTASLSNPQQIVNAYDQGVSSAVVSQMDPNGVYTPASSAGTYVICVGADGKPYATYWEGFVYTIFGPAKWNATTHRADLIGPPSFKFTTHQGS